MPMDAVTAPMTPAPMARPGRTRPLFVFSLAKGCLPVSHERDAVDLGPVDAHLVVEVAAGGCAGRPDTGDGLACADVLAHADEDAPVADVGVAGVDAAPVVDEYEVAVGAVGTGVDDGARMGRVDRGVARGADVDAQVVSAADATTGRGACAEPVGDRAGCGDRPALRADVTAWEPA